MGKRTMKILFILGAYKPRASANGLCASNVIEHLKRQGHTVTVLANHTIGCDQHEIENGMEVYRVKQRLSLRLKEYGTVFADRRPITARLASGLAAVINKLQLFIMSPVWPRVSLGTIRRFKSAAMALQKQYDFDAVVSVYTPIETLLAGYELKKAYPKIKYIPYFLDSLSGGYGPRYFTQKRIIHRGLRIEKQIFPQADMIVAMKSSQEHQLKYNGEYREKIVFLDIPMLTRAEELPNFPVPKQKPYKFLFVGSISRNIRDPKTLIDALACMDNGDIVCEFVGNIDCIEAFSGLKQIMGERLIFTGYIHHDQLAEKIAGANVLLNVGNLISTMVPSKIFEYMSYLKPVISTYDIEDEPSAKYLSQYPLALLLSGKDKPESNAQKIVEFLENIQSKQVDYKTLEDQFYLNTPKAFVEALEKT